MVSYCAHGQDTKEGLLVLSVPSSFIQSRISLRVSLPEAFTYTFLEHLYRYSQDLCFHGDPKSSQVDDEDRKTTCTHLACLNRVCVCVCVRVIVK